ncbi:MAG: hypothetical protein ACTSSH_03930 [Candidatus Heimdallarchaeota archaeon]
MTVSISQEKDSKLSSKRFLTLDITRGLAIVGMFVLHIISDTLNIDELLSDLNGLSLINLLALVILPFLGGLAGFFLLISSTGNMISFYRELKKGRSVRGIVLKQIISGIILLAFAMLSEAIIGYHGVFGEVFKHLNNPSAIPWENALWRWNTFETVHTIAWCLIINGSIQGLLSLKENWKNTKRMIISYIVLAVAIIGLTQPIWNFIGNVIPGYPFTNYPNGHEITQPWIGYEPFWHIFRAPFVTALASPVEPIFPYLAVSFIGSIIGIVLSQPKEKISKKFPRRMFLVGLVMFVSGLIGVVIILINIMGGTYSPGTDPFDVTIAFYQFISFHRHWAPDAANIIFSGETVVIPRFSWLAQFIVLNGFSIMIFMTLFRFIEFRGKGNSYANKTKIVRRFGTVAFSNYNNQWIYNLVFFIVSLMIYQIAYQRVLWAGTFLILFLTLAIFSLLLWAWEKIKYTGSLEWFIKTVSNNVVPIRRNSFEEGTKWWQRGQINVERNFYNVNWIDLSPDSWDTTKDTSTDPLVVDDQKSKTEIVEEESKSGFAEHRDSKFALILSIVGLCSILFIFVSIFGLFISISARKTEGKNNQNTAALVMSIIGCILIVGILVTTFIVPIGALGLF